MVSGSAETNPYTKSATNAKGSGSVAFSHNGCSIGSSTEEDVGEKVARYEATEEKVNRSGACTLRPYLVLGMSVESCSDVGGHGAGGEDCSDGFVVSRVLGEAGLFGSGSHG